MKDSFGREIDYMRISITDRCDLRCGYCMPSPLPAIPHAEILRYEEFLRVCRAAISLGINRFKVTGGEPFARKGAADFIAALKAERGVICVTVTTNGTMLSDALPRLMQAGVDGVNISLDALNAVLYQSITGFDRAGDVLKAIIQCAQSGIRTKVNCVLLDCNRSDVLPIAELSRDLPLDVRFIELMPIGCGRSFHGPSWDEVFGLLKQQYPDLQPHGEKRGNGPAVYYASSLLKGRIGVIAANSHTFCGSCNRLRVTSTGMLKPCLSYGPAADLRALLRGGASDDALAQAIAGAVYAKPAAHCFSAAGGAAENRRMHEIGG